MGVIYGGGFFLVRSFDRLMRRLGGLHGLIVMTVYRLGNKVFYDIKLPVLRHILWLFYRIVDFCFVRLFLGAEFPARCRIGHNIHLPHGGNGIIINGYAVIGDDVTIYHQVTIGVRSSTDRAPIIGNGVLIGAGAKILGPITIGEGARIGANAVVIRDVPPYVTAVGVPAQNHNLEGLQDR